MLPRVRICDLPTPVRAAPGLGADVWVKDDALSADPWGGNKPRKLEWILGSAKARGFGTVATFGAIGTNHGLATAIYARREGLDCVLGLVEQPRTERVERQLARLRENATRVYLTRNARRTALTVPYLAVRHAQLSPPRPPYFLPPGGSSPLGTVGFVEAAFELAAQVDAGELPEPRAVVAALGSGGTVAGLAAGLALAGLRTEVHAVLVNDTLKLTERTVTRLARRTLALLAKRGVDVRVEPRPVRVIEEFMGAGYGHDTPEAGEALRLAREAEGLDLEPVYTAKTLAALMAGASGDGPVVFWNTNNGREYG
jgi:D-cysteine desulfhydrase